MSDHLLRLARIVAEVAYLWPDPTLMREAKELVRDLEAAPQSAPERRTITREEFDDVMYGLGANGLLNHREHAEAIMNAWRLTVEDA